MWDTLFRAPRGSNNPRKFSMLLATFFVALLGYIFATSPSVSAIEGTWEGDQLVFDGKTYEAVENKDSLPNEIKASPHVYQFTDTTANPNLVYFIYFANDVVDPQREGEATYIRYTLNPPNRYVNPFDKLTIALVPIPPSADQATTDEPALTSSCTIGGIGWIVCPLMNGIAEVMDFVFTRIRAFLEVQPITTSVDNPIYRIWVYSRDLANIAFIIGFMVIIYSYLVGGGFSGYEIRKILPRLVMAAVLINLSYILCAIAVDISNITGYGVNQLFENVRDEVLPGSSTTADVSWTSVTTWVLAGGVGVGVLANVAPLATGGTLAAAGLWGLLSPFLVGGALLIMVTFFILAARQAIIVLLIAIAPLAFAAFILPNTEKWFEKWRSLFFTMLIMFPAFGAVFGAAQLAGEVLIRTATTIEQIILGLGVMVAPLAITPLLLRLGGGVLNRFGGIINSKEKGIYDRYKNYNSERRQEFLATQNKLNAQRHADGTLTGGRNFMRRAAYRKNLKNYNRKRGRDADTGRAEGFYDDDDQGIETFRSRAGRQFARGTGRGDQYVPTYRYGSAEIAETKHDTGLLHNYTEARHGEHWQEILRHDPRRAGMQTATRLATGRAKIDEDDMAAADESYLQQSINQGTTARYAALRDARIQTSVNKGVGELNSGQVDAEGQQEFRRTVEDSRVLSRVVKDTYHAKKQAETYENIVQKAAESSWNDRVRNDDDTQTLYLKGKRNEDSAQYAEQRLKTLVQDIRTKGSDAPNVAVSSQGYADNIKDLVLKTDVARNAEAAAQSKERTNLAITYKASAALRMKAGGIGGEAAANLVYAKAFQTMVKDQVDGTNAEKTILSQTDSDEIFKRMDNPDASVEQLAAYAGTIASRGYHAHHIKLLGKASRMYQEAVDSGDEEQVSKMRDMIQQIGSDQSKTAFGVRDFDRTLLGEGRYDANIFETTRERILTNLSTEVMASMDPDDIHLLYEMHRKNLLTDEQSQKIRDVWNDWKEDDILKSKIQTKHKNFFDRIATDDYTSSIDGMSAPTQNKYGLTEQDFGRTPPDVTIRNS